MEQMRTSQLNALSTEELWQEVHHWTSQQWMREINKLTPEQIAAVLPAATSKYDDTHWKEKLAAAISGLTERTQLEAAGAALSLMQNIQILSYVSKEPSLLDKLPPLFVGMPHAVFSELLMTISSEQQLTLKKEALTEALQHHLTLVAQELTINLTPYRAKLSLLNKELAALSLDEIGQIAIETILKSINNLIEEGLRFVKLANCSLAIAWNTLRLDLIDQISELKEHYQRVIAHDGGLTKTETLPATGLFAVLESRLNSIFADTNASGQSTPMADETPAIEAIVKFGIWYIGDYRDIGLLPNIAHKKQLDISLENKPLEQQAEREQLFIATNKHLEGLGLATLHDLKKAGIYSKKALKDYIDKYPGGNSPQRHRDTEKQAKT